MTHDHVHKLKDLTSQDSRFSCFWGLTRDFQVSHSGSYQKSSLSRLSLMIPCLILAVFNSLTNSCVLKKNEMPLKCSDENAQCRAWSKHTNQTKDSIFISVGNNSVLCSLPTMPVGETLPSQPIYFSLNIFLSIKAERTFLDEHYIMVRISSFLDKL